MMKEHWLGCGEKGRPARPDIQRGIVSSYEWLLRRLTDIKSVMVVHSAVVGGGFEFDVHLWLD